MCVCMHALGYRQCELTHMCLVCRSPSAVMVAVVLVAMVSTLFVPTSVDTYREAILALQVYVEDTARISETSSQRHLGSRPSSLVPHAKRLGSAAHPSAQHTISSVPGCGESLR